jgi:hypothetical protein
MEVTCESGFRFRVQQETIVQDVLELPVLSLTSRGEEAQDSPFTEP